MYNVHVHVHVALALGALANVGGRSVRGLVAQVQVHVVGHGFDSQWHGCPGLSGGFPIHEI